MATRNYEKVIISNTSYGIKIDAYKQNNQSGAYAIRNEGGNIFVYYHGALIACASAYTMRVRTQSPFND